MSLLSCAGGEDREKVSYLERLAGGRLLPRGGIVPSPDSRKEINHAKILQTSALGRTQVQVLGCGFGTFKAELEWLRESEQVGVR